MDRNQEMKYAELSTMEMPRSQWTKEFTHKTSFNAGWLVPFLVDMDIIPGQTVKNSTSVVLRMTTPVCPVMDNLYLDTYYFKCSKFWYWEHWRRMMGENDYGAWTQTIDYSEPKIKSNTTYPYGPNDLASYIGTVMGVSDLSFSKIAVNAIIDIWNQWFRSQSLQAPYVFDKTDANLNADGTIFTGCGMLPVAKFHDYFTSALPEPQKGNPVTMPLGTSAPIKYSSEITATLDNTIPAPSNQVGHWGNSGANAFNAVISADKTKYNILTDQKIYPIYADLSTAVAATINAQRLAFATQRILEKDARGGTRYRELLRNHFGVTPADESLLTPEYLGGKRTPINIETVLQTSSTTSTSPIGETGAMSITTDYNDDFIKSFTKDDILIGVCCVRADHTYQQGIRPALTRTKRLDRYWPSLCHIGNQPIYNREIYAQGDTVLNSNNTPVDNDVFGYKEAWQEYITPVNRISGQMSSLASTSLDVWHYGDDYSALPVLSDAWIKEPVDFIDRTLTVQSTNSNQFWVDFYVKQEVAAPIPLNRTPGLIDHF